MIDRWPRQRYRRPGWMLAGCIALAGCRGKEPPAAGREDAAASIHGALPASPRDRMATLDRAYRLAPDRRWLDAYGHVHALATGKRAAWTVEPEGERWSVRIAGTTVEAVATSGPETLNGLVRYARSLLETHPLALTGQAGEPKKMGAREAWAALEIVQRDWLANKRTLAAVQAGVSAWVSLVIEAADELDAADELASHAIAAVALERALGLSVGRTHEAWLLAALGYGNAARALEGRTIPTRPSPSPEDVLRVFQSASSATFASYEAALTQATCASSGTWIDTESKRLWLTAAFLSAVVRKSASIESTADARAFARSLGRPERPESIDVKNWLAIVLSMRDGQDVDKAPSQLLLHPTLKAAPRLTLFRAMAEHMTDVVPRVFLIGRELATHVDARPTHQAELAHVARKALYDWPLFQRSARAAVQADDVAHANLLVDLAATDHDLGTLRRVATDPQMNTDAKLRALDELVRRDAWPPSDYVKQIEHLGAATDWPSRRAAAMRLESRGQSARARNLVTAWLAHAKPAAGARDEAQAMIARTFRLEGRHDDALRVLPPSTDQDSLDVTCERARALHARGDKAGALSLARTTAEREHAPRAYALVTELLFRDELYDEGAIALLLQPTSLSAEDWRDRVAPLVVDTAKRVPAHAKRIVAAFERAGAEPRALLAVAKVLSASGAHEAAFHWFSLLAPKVPASDRDAAVVAACASLTQARGAAEGKAWLSSQPSFRDGRLMEALFLGNQGHLLWDYAEEPAGNDARMRFWLLRLTHAVLAGHDDEVQRARDWFAKQVTDSPDAVIGRHLLGLGDESTVLRLAKDDASIARTSFYLGVRAMVDKRLDDASAFFRSAVETNRVDDLEYRAAAAELKAWSRTGP